MEGRMRRLDSVDLEADSLREFGRGQEFEMEMSPHAGSEIHII